MNCYFAYDQKHNTKVLIPGCWPVVHSNDISDCTCKETDLTFNAFEKKMFNDKVAELNKEIISLREGIEQLKKDNYELMNQLEL